MSHFTPNEKIQGTPLTEQTALVGEQVGVKMCSASEDTLSRMHTQLLLKGTGDLMAMREITRTKKPDISPNRKRVDVNTAADFLLSTTSHWICHD